MTGENVKAYFSSVVLTFTEKKVLFFNANAVNS